MTNHCQSRQDWKEKCFLLVFGVLCCHKILIRLISETEHSINLQPYDDYRQCGLENIHKKPFMKTAWAYFWWLGVFVGLIFRED